MNKTKKIWGILIFIAVFAAAVAVVMLLWNALVPTIIGWTSINYLQAAGLMVLCRLLFGGFGRHRGHGFFRNRCEKNKEVHQKMRAMSRDERREFIRQRMLKTFDKFCDDEDTSRKPENE